MVDECINELFVANVSELFQYKLTSVNLLPHQLNKLKVYFRLFLFSSVVNVSLHVTCLANMTVFAFCFVFRGFEAV